MAKQRLNKIIASAGICSRRKAEEFIIQERVRLNGKTAYIGDQADPTIDQIMLDGSPIYSKPPIKVILLNKPKGIITSCKDKHGRSTVLDLIPTSIRKGLHPIGRLDLESRGAILLTNYGELTLKLTHPSFQHSKTYKALVKGSPTNKSLDRWRQGLILDGKLTIKAKIEVLESSPSKSLLKIILREGRNRQIRRIANLIGNPVIDLQRTAISGIELGLLNEGQWKELIEDEWIHLLQNQKNYT